MGFVIPETGELFVTKPEKFNYITTISSIRDFLSVLQTSNDKKVLIIMDNAPWHKKAYRLIYIDKLPEYEDIRTAAEILMLPPYSPDFNPIERVWRVTRRENTHNVFFKSIQHLEKKVDKAFESWRHPNRKLATLCGCQ